VQREGAAGVQWEGSVGGCGERVRREGQISIWTGVAGKGFNGCLMCDDSTAHGEVAWSVDCGEFG